MAFYGSGLVDQMDQMDRRGERGLSPPLPNYGPSVS